MDRERAMTKQSWTKAEEDLLKEEYPTSANKDQETSDFITGVQVSEIRYDEPLTEEHIRSKLITAGAL